MNDKQTPTPGNWSVEDWTEVEGNDSYLIARLDTLCVVADFEGVMPDYEAAALAPSQYESADALVLAAAKDAIKACEAVLDYDFEENWETRTLQEAGKKKELIALLKTAIAKAKGGDDD